MSRIRFKLRTLLLALLVICIFITVPRHVIRYVDLQHELTQLKSRDIVFYRDWSSDTPEQIGGVVNGRHCFISDHCRFLRGGHELTVQATDTGITVSIDGHTTDCQNVRISFDWSTASFNDWTFFERIGIDFDMDEYVTGNASNSSSEPFAVNLATGRPE